MTLREKLACPADGIHDALMATKPKSQTASKARETPPRMIQGSAFEDVLKAGRTRAKEFTRSPEAARAILIKEGILTPSGRLTSRYS